MKITDTENSIPQTKEIMAPFALIWGIGKIISCNVFITNLDITVYEVW
jgi:hypothetical protein